MKKSNVADALRYVLHRCKPPAQEPEVVMADGAGLQTGRYNPVTQQYLGKNMQNTYVK